MLLPVIRAWHDQSTDDVDDHRRTRQQREQEESDSKECRVNVEVLGKSAENTEKPSVGG